MKKQKNTLQYWDAEYKTTTESAKAILSQFSKLVEDKKYKEALELYLKEQGAFFVGLEHSTKIFEFHSDFIIPMLFKYKESAIAYQEAIRILEMELLITEAVIVFSNGNNIPTHYGKLISDLERLYINVGGYKEAIALTDKVLKYSTNEEERACVYNNKAYIYRLMGNKTAAIKSAEKAISILKKIDLQDDTVYNNCLKIIADIKGKPKQNHLFEETYYFW